MHLKRLYLLFFTILSSMGLRAQVQNHFEHLTIRYGLSHSVIFSIVQDKKGFIWLATQDGGLNKYDGYKFTVILR